MIIFLLNILISIYFFRARNGICIKINWVGKKVKLDHANSFASEKTERVPLAAAASDSVRPHVLFKKNKKIS